MDIVKSKYRGTKEYHLVYQELITAAQYRGLTTYQDIAVLMGLEMSGNLMGSEVGQILGEIVEDETDQGRPMLSAVAVSRALTPSEGFFVLARQLQLLKDGENKAKFWQETLKKCYETWRRPLPKKQK